MCKKGCMLLFCLNLVLQTCWSISAARRVIWFQSTLREARPAQCSLITQTCNSLNFTFYFFKKIIFFFYFVFYNLLCIKVQGLLAGGGSSGVDLALLPIGAIGTHGYMYSPGRLRDSLALLTQVHRSWPFPLTVDDFWSASSSFLPLKLQFYVGA